MKTWVKVHNSNKVIWLITSRFLGFSHYYGKLHITNDESYNEYKLTRTLTKAEAVELNRLENRKTYREGLQTERFDSLDGIIECARNNYKTIFPEAVILINAGCSVAAVEPQLTLDCTCKKTGNSLNDIFDNFESIEGWDRDKKQANILSDNWYELINELIENND